MGVNCRGEKIAPVEIDGILLSHPAIAEAVCFAVPDDMYGQEIHAAVVFKQGKSATEQELQKFIGEKAAKFKIPTKVYSLIPDFLMVRSTSRKQSQRQPPEKSKGPKLVSTSSNQRQEKRNCKGRMCIYSTMY